MVKEKRGFVDPNLGFVGQLMDLDRKFKFLRAQSRNHQQKALNFSRIFQLTKSKERIKQVTMLQDIKQEEFNRIGSVYLAQLPEEFVLFVGNF